MRFFTKLKLGPNREVLPNGFVLFKNVSIARTGEQVYGPGETSIEPGPDGLVYITRTPEEVFRPETIASFNGGTFTIDHPVEDVVPENWRQLAHGFLLHPRRGTGDQKDELVGDLLVTSTDALSDIDSGTREVSAGYDADYYETGRGRGEQRQIVGNHVALVDAGRCGPRCAIRDHKHETKECHMKTRMEKFLDAFKSKDEDAFTRALGDLDKNETHIHVHTADAKHRDEDEEEKEEAKKKKVDDEDEEESEKKEMKEVKDSISALQKTMDSFASKFAAALKTLDKAKDEDEDEEDDEEESEKKKDKTEDDDEDEDEGVDDRKKGRDSSYLADEFQVTVSVAEVIHPGIKIPTFDRALSPKKTRDCICALQRKVLQRGTKDEDTAEVIKQARGRAVDSAAIIAMPCGEVSTLFHSVGALKRAQNNGASVAGAGAASVHDVATMTPQERFQDGVDRKYGNGKYAKK